MRFIALSVFCSVLPDADVIGFAFGIPYSHLFGHRGFFHSLSFASMLAAAAVLIFFRDRKLLSVRSSATFIYFFLLNASHGLLDTVTVGGLGVALLAPFDNTRYLAPFALFEAAPLSLNGLFTPWGLRCMGRELLLIWMPASVTILWSRLRCR